MRRLSADGAPPAEDRDLRLRTRAYTIASTSLLAVSVLFTVLGFALGRPLVTISSAVLFGAAVVGIAVGYRRNRRLDRALRLLLVAGMAYVTVGHILLGGLAASGGALAWGLVAPILALLLFDAASALRWLAAYVVIVVAVVVLDPLIVRAAPATWSVAPPLLHAISVIGPALIVFGLVRHVVGERVSIQRQYHGLLLRILPAAIVERLTAGETPIAEHHESVSVVMADIAGFTAFAGRARPEEILALLTEVFATFDRLAAELGVEKIKTIGDAYMAVAGAPLEQADHAERAVALAIAMQREAPAMPSLAASGLGMRVGVASGAVTAGVIGTQKPAYDVWGDTVNLASRMETTGVIGQIQLAASTAKLVSASYRLIRRESVSIKGKGEMTTYLLDPATA